jgi:hypothetical protein
MDEREGAGRPRSPLPHCEVCGDRIGVYEPLVMRTPQGWMVSSIAAEPELAGIQLSCRHAECAAAARGDEARGS